MIVTREESEVAVLGEVEKHNVSIDAKNINHIVTILSSNLYSYPMTSFLRETVSNAVDSHIEAGVNEPIIITRTKSDLSIRDFGTGISPERFKEIYLNIGSSTKRDSNDYIGHFGIGRFSCLSVCNLANITSFYNGRAYYYVMNKDIDQLHIDFLFEKDTDEPNGVEVKVPITEVKLSDLNCLEFVENIYLEDEIGDLLDFNKRKVSTYKNFKTVQYKDVFFAPSRYDTYVLVGNIPYKVDFYSLWDEDDKYHLSWRDAFTKAFPIVDIGKVDITPNRETLIYSEKTKQVLHDAFLASIEEMEEFWKNQVSQPYTDIKEWLFACNGHNDNILMLDGVNISVSNQLDYQVKYEGRPEWDSIPFKTKKELTNKLLYHHVSALGVFSDKRISTAKDNTSLTIRHLLDRFVGPYTYILRFPSQAGFSSKYLPGFISENYFYGSVLLVKEPRISGILIRQHLRSILGMTGFLDKNDTIFLTQLLRELLSYMDSHSEFLDIMSDPGYISYKKEHMERSSIQRVKGVFNFTITDCNLDDAFAEKCSFEDIVSTIKKYRNRKYRIVWSSLDNPFREAFRQMGYNNLYVLSVPKISMHYIEDGCLPSWIKPIESLYSEDNKVLQRMAAAMYVYSHYHYTILCDKSVLSYFPKSVREKIEKLNTLCSYYKPHDHYKSNGCSKTVLKVIPEEKYDVEIMSLYHSVKKYLDIAKKVVGYEDASDKEADGFFWYSLMKAKKVRIDFTKYMDIRNKINKLTEAV